MVRPTSKKPQKRLIDRVDSFRVKHKLLFTLIVIGILVVVFGGLIKYGTYQSKFSDKDYAALEATAEKVFNNVGANEVEKYEYCSYEAPEKYSSVKLYCEVGVAAYLPYENDQRAVEVAKILEREVKKLGSTISDLQLFYDNPRDNLSGISVNISQPVSRTQCRFTIGSNTRARDISSHLPKKDGDGLVALLFDCSAESREEYFPVTYRQGQ